MKTCSIRDCGGAATGHGYCPKHNWKFRKYGDPLAGKTKRSNGTGSVYSGYLVKSDRNGHKTMGHVAIVESVIGRKLRRPEEIHHVNEDRLDNRHENLVLCPDRAYHKLLHQRMRALAASGHSDWRKCSFCKTYDDPNDLYIQGTHSFHRKCHANYETRRNQ